MLHNNNPPSFVKPTNPYAYLEAFSHLAGHEKMQENLDKAPASYSFTIISNEGQIPLISQSIIRCPAAEKMPSSTSCDHIADCHTLTATQLRQRYPREYTCWRNMKERTKKKGSPVDPEFEDFRSYLKHVGPQPARKATIDRINNADPEYAPGKIRWADKHTQNSNKGDSLLFFDPVTMQSFTTTQLAGRQGMPADTIRHRRRRGWTDPEIIAGKRSASAPVRRDFSEKADLHSRRTSTAVGRRLTEKERRFTDEAAYYERQRRIDGMEPICADYETLVEVIHGGDYSLFSPEQYERYFAEKWPGHRPHLDFDNPTLPKSQKELIEKIDPQYVRAWNSKKAHAAKLQEHL